MRFFFDGFVRANLRKPRLIFRYRAVSCSVKSPAGLDMHRAPLRLLIADCERMVHTQVEVVQWLYCTSKKHFLLKRAVGCA